MTVFWADLPYFDNLTPNVSSIRYATFMYYGNPNALGRSFRIRSGAEILFNWNFKIICSIILTDKLLFSLQGIRLSSWSHSLLAFAAHQASTTSLHVCMCDVGASRADKSLPSAQLDAVSYPCFGLGHSVCQSSDQLVNVFASQTVPSCPPTQWPWNSCSCIICVVGTCV